MSKRLTVTFDSDLAAKIKKFSKLWNVKESEVMRRIFALGSYFAEELTEHKTLMRRDEATGELVKLEFPGIITRK